MPCEVGHQDTGVCSRSGRSSVARRTPQHSYDSWGKQHVLRVAVERRRTQHVELLRQRRHPARDAGCTSMIVTGIRRNTRERNRSSARCRAGRAVERRAPFSSPPVTMRSSECPRLADRECSSRSCRPKALQYFGPLRRETRRRDRVPRADRRAAVNAASAAARCRDEHWSRRCRPLNVSTSVLQVLAATKGHLPARSVGEQLFLALVVRRSAPRSCPSMSSSAASAET